MHWLYLLLALGAMLLALTTVHGWLLVLSLLAAVALSVAWIRGWYQERIGDNQRDESAMIDPLELRRLRELAEARKREAAAQTRDPAPPSA
ncbi:hypothetical protein [Pseudoxanthomonas koreensis]|uniref:hypothetical protein n=1 Tax=Pseudoxanthomonas koreensis TaxID=266061 RepID=UPI001391AD07|nr:hypothetical protein [Pseudoxanthomonas koreensis]KAF1691282.1 hypothetical protein CSC64_09765 [Pseudoxanthomonas koreensis]